MPGPLSRGRAWVENLLSDGVPEVNSDSVSTVQSIINADSATDAPLYLKGRHGESDSKALALAAPSDPSTGPNADKAYIRWLDSNDDYLSQLVTHEKHNHLSLYGNDGLNTTPTKKLDVEFGPGDNPVDWLGVSRFLISGESENRLWVNGDPPVLRLRHVGDGHQYEILSNTEGNLLVHDTTTDSYPIVHEGDENQTTISNVNSGLYEVTDTPVLESGDFSPVKSYGPVAKRSGATTETTYTGDPELLEFYLKWDEILSGKMNSAMATMFVSPGDGETVSVRLQKITGGSETVLEKTGISSSGAIQIGPVPFTPSQTDFLSQYRIQTKTDPGTNESSIITPEVVMGVDT